MSTLSSMELEQMAMEAVTGMRGLALGAPFLGTCFDGLLLGVIICQLTHWIPNARHDDKHVRILVTIAAVAALVGTAFTWATYMTAFVYDFGLYTRFITLEYVGWYGVLDILIVVPVQLFFAERSVRINNRSVFLAVTNGLLIAATAAMGIAFTVVSRGHTVFSRPQMLLNIATSWPAVCTCTHIWITSTIIYGLVISRTSSSRANKLLSRLMVISIESQLPSTLVGITLMSFIVADYKSPIIPFVAIVHPKVFFVGMLAMVNLRHSWRVNGKVPHSYQDTEMSRPRTGVFGSSSGSTSEDAQLGTPKQAAFDLSSHDLCQSPSRAISDIETGMEIRKDEADFYTTIRY